MRDPAAAAAAVAAARILAGSDGGAAAVVAFGLNGSGIPAFGLKGRGMAFFVVAEASVLDVVSALAVANEAFCEAEPAMLMPFLRAAAAAEVVDEGEGRDAS